MKINHITPNIIHFDADNRYELCSTFIRIQEFYESPFPEFKGKYFSLDDYMDHYAQSNDNKFTYFEDWTGFNIPGHSLVEFYNIFIKNELGRPKEKFVFESIKEFIDCLDSNSKFYVIGTVNADKLTLDHEIRHACYYLNSEYQQVCKNIYQQLPDDIKKVINDKLTEFGYDKFVFEDETQAYFGSETHKSLRKRFQTKLDLSKWNKLYSSLNPLSYA